MLFNLVSPINVLLDYIYMWWNAKSFIFLFDRVKDMQGLVGQDVNFEEKTKNNLR